MMCLTQSRYSINITHYVYDSCLSKYSCPKTLWRYSQPNPVCLSSPDKRLAHKDSF